MDGLSWSLKGSSVVIMVRPVKCLVCECMTLVLEHEPPVCKECGAKGVAIVVGPLEPLIDSFTHLKG